MPSLSIPKHLMDICYQHAIQHIPHEACGVLSGPFDANHVDQFYPLENIINQLHAQNPQHWPRNSRNGYVIDPQAFLKLQNQLQKKHQAIKIYMHSHIDVGAYFSEEDQQRASLKGQPLLPEALYLVCAVKNKQPDGAILVWFDAASQAFQSLAV